MGCKCSLHPGNLHPGLKCCSKHTQARKRNRCSNLNQDLYLNRLRDTGVCDCGSDREDAELYFFKCHKYLHERRKRTHRYHPVNLDTVLRGRDALSFEENVAIFKSVHEDIRDTNRF